MNKSKYTKFIASFLCSAMILSQSSVIVTDTYAASNSFNMGSVNHWSEPYMKDLYLKGLIRGDEHGNMNPDENITRAEFVSMINRAFGYDKIYGDPFSDIKGNEWYADDIVIAYNQGYFLGSENKANPTENLTREEAVTLLCRNLGVLEIPGENFSFTDSRNFQSWSKGYINTASEKGYIGGYSDGTFRANVSITRGEACKFLNTAIGELIDTSGTHYFGRINGNATITSSNVTIEDTTITGDLYITEGVDLGNIILDNVRVLGEVIISGTGESHAGESSIQIIDCDLERLIIGGRSLKPKSIKLDGDTVIKSTLVMADAYLEDLTSSNDGFIHIELNGPSGTVLSVTDTIDKVIITGKNNTLNINSGYIKELIVDEYAIGSVVNIGKNSKVRDLYIDVAMNVKGLGEIGYVKVNASGVIIDMMPNKIEIRPGITANIGGIIMDSDIAMQESSYPRIIFDYPKIKAIGPSSADAIFKTNKFGTLSYVLTLKTSSSIDTKDIITPDLYDKRIVDSGKIEITDIDIDTKISLTSLAQDTEYTLYAVLSDARNQISNRAIAGFKTLDNTQMGFISGYPKAKVIRSNDVDLSIVPTRDATAYYAILPKDSVPPDAESLLMQVVPGAVDKGSVVCSKNIESIVNLDGLAQRTEYDIYLLVSKEGMTSSIKRINIETTDTTPPNFHSFYPKVSAISEKSIEITVKTDEDATLYYSLYKNGADFPVPVPPSTTTPLPDSEEAKDQVVLGNGSIKTGKANLRTDVEGKFNITGLEPETAYDLYMVVRDRYGNTSTYKKLDIKTFDNIAPTATLRFDQVADGDVMVNSEIQIIFSEEILDTDTFAPLENNIKLNKNIKLYDMSTSIIKEITDIKYDEIKIDLIEGKTVITFPAGSLPLKSGNSYEFELNRITDTSHNNMSERTRLPTFKTAAPFVEIATTVTDPKHHMSFHLNPLANETSENIYYDIIFTSSRRMEFKLYEKTPSGWVSLFGDSTAKIGEGSSKTLEDILDRDLFPSELDFKVFNDFDEKREFAIEITDVEGLSNPLEWNGKVEMDIQCVVGSYSNLQDIADSPKYNLEDALNNGALIASYPKDFTLTKPFVDKVIPIFLDESPKLDIDSGDGIAFDRVGDTFIRPIVKTNKSATFYYLISPIGTVTDPDTYDIMNGSLKPSGGVTGSFEIENGNVDTEVYIEGLLPEIEYDFYYFLKGIPEQPSELPNPTVTFTTKKMDAPIFESVIISPEDGSANSDFKMDKECTVSWVVYNEDTQPTTTDQDELINLIINASESGGNDNIKVTDYGTVNAEFEVAGSSALATVNISNLERPHYYVLYAVAKSDVGGGYSLVYKTTSPFTPVDGTPPTISSISTVIQMTPDEDGMYEPPYKGVVNISFSEPLFYKESESAPHQALSKSFFIANLESDLTWVVSKFQTVNTSSGIGLQSITLKFSEAYNNSFIVFPFLITDQHGNIAGKLNLTLEPTNVSPEFTYEFNLDDN